MKKSVRYRVRRTLLVTLAWLIAALTLFCSVSCGSGGTTAGENGEIDKPVEKETENTGETGTGAEGTDEPEDPQPHGPTEPTEPIRTAEEVAYLYSRTQIPTVYTVGEDRYDLDCAAFLYRNTKQIYYRIFLETMAANGFEIHATNGENGIDGACCQATLVNGYLTVNVTRFTKSEEIYITVEKAGAVSPLQNAPEKMPVGTDTVYHNPKHPTVNGSYKFGELDIFELSNDHFVVVDGAQEYSAEMFVSYLEDLAGEGKTPVIDAWFFTHAHPDHIYCCYGVGRDENLCGRIRVNGFYYTFPNDAGVSRERDYDGLIEQIGNLNSVIGRFRTEDGRVTPRYKLHAGMTFYVGELKAEVLLTQDQLMPSEYASFNDSSTSFRFTLYTEAHPEGTTFLIMGDANTPVCNRILTVYDYGTLHTNYFTSLHHGNNDVPDFFRFIAPDYLIYTAPNIQTKTGYAWLNSHCLGVFVAPSVIRLS